MCTFFTVYNVINVYILHGVQCYKCVLTPPFSMQKTENTNSPVYCRVNTNIITCVHAVINSYFCLHIKCVYSCNLALMFLAEPEISINMSFTHMELLLYPSKYVSHL